MKKVIIIGCPGSGKTTFAEKLNKITGLPLYYLDTIWHKPDKTHIPREEFDERIADIFSKSEWIIDGNYKRTIEARLKECDTVFLFDLPTEVCLQGIINRIGKERYDLPWLEKELDPEFKKFVEDFPEDTLPYIYELLEKYNDRNIFVFKSREEAESYLKSFISFEFIDKAQFINNAEVFYSIFDNNMQSLEPSVSFEGEYKAWFRNVSEGLESAQRKLIRIKCGEDTVGFFQYYINNDLFMMEEIQLKPEYQGNGIFRALYGYVLPLECNGVKYVEAYTHYDNYKSMAILGKMGLREIDSNAFKLRHFRGSYSDLQKWLEKG